MNEAIAWVLSASAAIASIGAAIGMIGKWILPVVQAKKLADKNAKRLDGIDRDRQAMLTALYALLDHEITNNSIEKLKTARDELTHYMIEK